MMDYSMVSDQTLFKYLIENTERLVKLLSAGIYTGEDFIECRDVVENIQKEIQKRFPQLYGTSGLAKMQGMDSAS